MGKLPYEAKLIPPDDEYSEWWVWAEGDGGDVYLATFEYQDAEALAREYAQTKFACVNPELGHRPRAAQ